ncbi:MAG TPA: SCP2 sterol-binding domain-containing protein [Rhodoferax sp.]|nr:SCP2 sterol-binding domain-containing protein [Rhodoferax sp.]
MASTTPYTLPGTIGALLSRLPAYPGSLLLVTALNQVLVPLLPQDVRAILRGKKLRIHVSDARVTLDFTCDGSRFSAMPSAGTTDLTISACAHDFLRLAQRQEDPDTLFFNRRLSMEGDTELGLVVKNTLDGLELPVFDLQQWTPPQVLARIMAKHRAGTGAHAEGRP